MKNEVFPNSFRMKMYMRKKISLFFVCFGIISVSAVAQEVPKAKKAQEPVKVAPMVKEEKLVKVSASEVKRESAPEKTAATVPTAASKTPMNNKAKMKRLPVKARRAESVSVKVEK